MPLPSGLAIAGLIIAGAKPFLCARCLRQMVQSKSFMQVVFRARARILVALSVSTDLVHFSEFSVRTVTP